jgi:hypothetical protein
MVGLPLGFYLGWMASDFLGFAMNSMMFLLVI